MYPNFVKGCVSGHVISRMLNDDLHWTGNLEPNISKTLGDRQSVTMEHLYMPRTISALLSDITQQHIDA